MRLFLLALILLTTCLSPAYAQVTADDKCVPACTNSDPAHATLCAGADQSLTAPTEKSTVVACTGAVKCEFKCDTGFSPDATNKQCV